MKNGINNKLKISPTEKFVQTILEATKEYFSYEHSQKIKRGLAISQKRKK